MTYKKIATILQFCTSFDFAQTRLVTEFLFLNALSQPHLPGGIKFASINFLCGGASGWCFTMFLHSKARSSWLPHARYRMWVTRGGNHATGA